MEEKKTKDNEQQKLSYEELSKAASDLHVQYQKLMVEYQKAMNKINQLNFDSTAFFLSMLFKVMEHTEEYKEEFVKWAVDNIQSALVTYADTIKQIEEEEKGETE